MITFFETNYWIGENSIIKENTCENDESIAISLKKRKETYNINSTVISHFSSILYSPRIGNDLIAKIMSKEISNYNLSGILTFEIEYFLTPADFEKHISKRYSKGFKLLRLSPKTHRYSIGTLNFKRFYEVLNYHKFPIIIGLGELDITGNKNIDWDIISIISSKFENILIIIDGQDLKLNFLTVISSRSCKTTRISM